MKGSGSSGTDRSCAETMLPGWPWGIGKHGS